MRIRVAAEWSLKETLPKGFLEYRVVKEDYCDNHPLKHQKERFNLIPTAKNNVYFILFLKNKQTNK